MKELPKYILNFALWKVVGVDHVPRESGVYVILGRIPSSQTYDIIYIGSSKCLERRLHRHPIILKHSDEWGVKTRIHFIEFDDYLLLEKEMIKRHSPLANKQHNG